MASGAKLTIVSRGELPRAEGPAREKSRKMGYFLEGQSPRSNDPAVLWFGLLEATRGHLCWGQESWATSLLRIHSQLGPEALPSGMLEPGCTSSPQQIAGSTAFVKHGRY